jgi:hypothetical protein
LKKQIVNLAELKAFYKRYRLFIISGLIILLALQWCQIQADKAYRDDTMSQSHQLNLPNHEVQTPQRAPRGGTWMPYLIMVSLILLVFIIQRRGWINNLFPKVIIFRIQPFRAQHKLMLRLFIYNAKKQNQTFDAPIIEFLKLGKTISFKLTVNSSEASFPITLTHSVAHNLVIDLHKFYQARPNLRHFYFIRARITVNGSKTIRTFPRFIWVKANNQ